MMHQLNALGVFPIEPSNPAVTVPYVDRRGLGALAAPYLVRKTHTSRSEPTQRVTQRAAIADHSS